MEQAKPVQVLPPDTVLCLMSRKILKKKNEGKMTEKQQPENKWAGSGRGPVTVASFREGKLKEGQGLEGRCLQEVSEPAFLSKLSMQRRRKSAEETERMPAPQGRREPRGKAGQNEEQSLAIPLGAKQESSCHARTGICEFFCCCWKVPKVNILGFAGHTVSITTLQVLSP